MACLAYSARRRQVFSATGWELGAEERTVAAGVARLSINTARRVASIARRISVSNVALAFAPRCSCSRCALGEGEEGGGDYRARL